MSNIPLDVQLGYASPYEIANSTAMSKDKLANLIKGGLIKAKRIDGKVYIQIASVRSFFESFPDIVPESEAEATPLKSGPESFNEQRREAMNHDLFA
jgi:hypothetical protein